MKRRIELENFIRISGIDQESFQELPEYSKLCNLSETNLELLDTNLYFVSGATDYISDNIEGGGKIEVSYNAGYSFAFFPNGVCKLSDPYQLVKQWLKVGDNRNQAELMKNTRYFYDRNELAKFQVENPKKQAYFDPFGPFFEEPDWIAESCYQIISRKDNLKIIYLNSIYR